MLTQLNSLRDAIHANAIEKGFYDEAHHDTHYLALIIEEIGEAISADRKGQRANTEAYQAAINTHHRPIEEAYATYIKGSLEEEIADICIRLLDFAGHKQVDLTMDKEDMKEIEKVNNAFIDKASNVDELTTYSLFSVAINLTSLIEGSGEMKSFILALIKLLDCLSRHLGFGLLYHIKEKMAYNATRPRLHGKKY